MIQAVIIRNTQT